MNRDEILETTSQIIRERGFSQTRLTDVANKMGITHPVIYRYFNSKRELFESLTNQFSRSTEFTLEMITKKSRTSIADHTFEYLWMLAEITHDRFINDRQLFNLDCHCYQTDDIIFAQHLQRIHQLLVQLLQGYLHNASMTDRMTDRMTDSLLTAFAPFYDYHFASQWSGSDYQVRFSSLFNLIFKDQLTKIA